MLLLDNSAWARRRHPAARERIAAALGARELGVCLPFLLEAGYSAMSRREHDGLAADLSRLPRVAITPRIERLAFKAQGELAQIGHHRLAPLDVIIAACAHKVGAGVLHYDRDYDILAEQTSLSFKSEWMAPPGTL